MEISKEQSKNKIREITIKEQSLPIIEFKTGNMLIIDKENGDLTLLAKNQTVQLVISVREEGIILNLNAYQLNINSANELNLSGRKVNIDAKEQINIKTGGNLVQQIDKDSLSEVGGTNKMIAKIQKLTATLGNVDIKANDDVRIDGERVKLNCD